jgi:hypothetical protein
MISMTVTERVKKHRDSMRERGFRPIQIWVPDVHSEEFAKEAVRQAAGVAEADRHSDDQEFVDAISVFWEGE